MNSISGYIDKHPGEAQRLVGLNYDKLKQLIKQAITLVAIASPYTHMPSQKQN